MDPARHLRYFVRRTRACCSVVIGHMVRAGQTAPELWLYEGDHVARRLAGQSLVTKAVARVDWGRMATSAPTPGARAHGRARRLTDRGDVLADGGRARLHHVAGEG